MFQPTKNAIGGVGDTKYIIYNDDCLKRMKDIPDDSISLILTDLPYGCTGFKWDKIIPFEDLWAEYRRVLKKPHGVVALFAQQPFTTRVISSNYEWYKYNHIWEKRNSTKFQLSHYRPMTRTEDVCIFSPGGCSKNAKWHMTYNPQGLKRIDKVCRNKRNPVGVSVMGNSKTLSNGEAYIQEFTNYPDEFLRFDNDKTYANGEKVKHGTTKPVALLEHLIRTYSYKHDWVLDSTMGSGSTGVACMRTDRNFYGIELNPEYYEIAKERLHYELTN